MRFDTQAKLANFLTQVEFLRPGSGLSSEVPIDHQGDHPGRSAPGRPNLPLHPDNYILVVVGNLKEAGME